MVISPVATIEERIASATVRWTAAVGCQMRGRQMLCASQWLVDSSRATLDRPGAVPFRGGVDVPFPVDSSIVRSRLRGLMDAGVIPAVLPRRLFIGPCLEDHECTACGVDIHKGEQEFDWTNPSNRVLYFHRRCVEIYGLLKEQSPTPYS